MAVIKVFPKPVARALARWIVLLLGWVWLGAQGQRLGWALASGVVPVAFWWTMRLVLAQSRTMQSLPRSSAGVLGVLTSLGALLITIFPQLGLDALLLLALFWAAWLALLDASAATSHCSRRWVGWPPLIAASLCALATAAPLSVSLPISLSVPLYAAMTVAAVPLLLLLATWLGREAPRQAIGFIHVDSHPAAVIPATAMGLMMGTLWLGSAWCSSAGWSNAQVVVLHLAVMSVLPALTRLELLPKRLPHLVAQRLPLVFVVAASLALLAGMQSIHGLVGMALLSIAWAMHSGRHVEASRTQGHASALGGLVVLGGPVLLLLVGGLSPLLGPQALQWAYGLLGALALINLFTSITARKTVVHPSQPAYRSAISPKKS
jgi:hypothetical protein